MKDVEREPDWTAWSELNANEFLERLVNDLEPPAFAISSQLARLREEIEKLLADLRANFPPMPADRGG